MKTFIVLLALMAAGSMRGQIGPVDQQFNTTPQHFADQALGLQPALKPNEIAGPTPDIKYSGIIPEAVKIAEPLQLINPFAPAEYGYGEQNLDLNITTQHAPGLKFFSIDF